MDKMLAQFHSFVVQALNGVSFTRLGWPQLNIVHIVNIKKLPR